MSNFIRTLPGGSIFGAAEDTKSRVQKQMTMRCCRDEIVEMKLEYGKIKMESPIRGHGFSSGLSEMSGRDAAGAAEGAYRADVRFRCGAAPCFCQRRLAGNGKNFIFV